MSDIMIIGGAGFIGSNLSNYLIQHSKYDICTVDNLRRIEYHQRLAASIAAKSRHTFYLADVRDEDIMIKLLKIEKPKVIIYTCFSGNDSEPLEDSTTFMRFMHSLSLSGIHVDKLISILPGSDDSKYTPAIVEDLSKSSACDEWFMIRAGNLFGPRQKMADPVPLIAHNLITTGGDWGLADNHFDSSREQWMYIKDFFFGLIEIFVSENQVESGIYRMKNGQFASHHDIFMHLKGILSKGEYHTWDETDGIIVEYGEKELVVKPNFDLREALEHTAVWYTHNKWAWR